ncbi:MAG: sugar ABC transporter permease [Treponema sp.]|jgi:multiple sugar transport system permease protein|nr:sugar ABC transporter permease [Treponema sp.]
MQYSKLTRSRTHFLFLAPHLIAFLIFFVIPIVYGIYASFTRWDMFNPPVWVGLQNYKTILFNKEATFYRQFWNGFSNTFRFVLMMVPLQIIVPLSLSLAIYAKPKGARIYQGIFYVPYLFSISAAVLSWLFILNPSYGLLNRTTGIFINWFGVQPYAWISILIVTTWWITGGNLLIYIAALNGINTEVLEYSKIDGVTGFRKLVSIYLPMIKLPLIFTVISSVAAQFNIYGQPLLLTRGNPKESTFVLIMYIARIAFGTGRPIAGMAASMAVMLGLCIGVLSVIQMRMLLKQSVN